MPSIIELESNGNVSKQCSFAIKHTFTSALQMKKWAFEMLDACGRLPIGVLSGTLGALGSYDQCLEVNSNDNNKNLPLIYGKYCLAQLKLPINLDMKVDNDSYLYEPLKYFHPYASPSIYNAFCVPSLCSENEVNDIITDVLKPMEIEVKITNCDTAHDQIILSISQKLMLCYVLTIGVLVVISMYFDHYYHTHPNFNDWGVLSLIVKAFSPVRNVKRLFLDRGTPNTEVRVDIIDSIRIVIILLIILAHVCMHGMMPVPEIMYQFRDLQRLSHEFVSQIIVNGSYMLETLFLLSGCLIVMNALKLFQKKKVSFILFAMHRWLRFTPLMLVAVAFNVLLPLIGNGPNLNFYHINEINSCDQRLWMNLLYINNFHTDSYMCTATTWCLSADFQLYLLSYFALVLLATKPNYGKLYVISFIVIGVTIPAILTYYWDIPPPMLLDSMSVDTELKANIGFYGTHQHLTPFFIGIGVGYIIVTNDKLDMSGLTQNVVTVILSTLTLMALFSSYLFTGLEFELTKSIATLYTIFFRFTISLGIGWIIIVTVSGNGGPNKIFKKFSKFNSKPLTKICFAIAMTNLFIARFTILYSRQHVSHGLMYFNILRFISTLLISVLVGFVVHVTVEAPFNILFSRLINSIAANNKPKQTVVDKRDEKRDQLIKKVD